MKNPCPRLRLYAVAVLALAGAAPLGAHHSFAGYDDGKTRVFTGVVQAFHPDANHVVIIFAPLNDKRSDVQRGADGKLVQWHVEFAEGSAIASRQGITVSAFKPRTVFTVALHPMRNGEHKGAREGPLFRCPDRNVPQPGKHCDSVEGHTKVGTGTR